MKKVLMIVLVGMAVFGVVCAGSKPEDMTREEKNKLLVQVAIGAMNTGDWEAMAKIYSMRFLQHGPGSSKPITWTEFELGCRVMKQKLPTARLEIMDMIAEGDKVAVRCKTVVTFKNGYPTRTRESDKVEFREMDLFRIKGGRIVEEWCECDMNDWSKKLARLKFITKWK